MKRFLHFLAVAAIVGHASWYSSADACGPMTNDSPGCPTAAGKSLYALERKGVHFVAMNGVEMGSVVKITYPKTGTWVEARVLDRGAFDSKYGRVADLGKKTFFTLTGGKDPGPIKVKIQKVK